MALIPCPECGREVSDQAPACIHCGYPLDMPYEEEARYALVLLDAGSDRKATLKQLAQWKDLTPEEAERLLSSLPLLLDRGLLPHQAREVRRVWEKFCGVKVVREENANSAEQAASSPGVDFDRLRRNSVPKPMTFGSVLGAVLAAMVIWSVVSTFLALMLGL